MSHKPVVLTLGEPAGIGGEIALMAWQKMQTELPFFLLADHKHMANMAEKMDIPVVKIGSPAGAGAAQIRGLPVLHHPLQAPAQPGAPNLKNAPVVVEMIERAVDLVQTGMACALTTNPIHKKALQDGAGFSFPGHTEFLGELGNIPCPVMMLSAPELRVVPVTIHIALNQVKTALTPILLEQTIRVTHAAMIADLNIPAPRIAVAGLNPHAGEGGVMGGDEITLITPVLDALRLEGLDLRGPIPADTMFHAAARETYDLALCMYHDQALIPLKTLNFAAGVNTTLGLPFIRTSPDHGTAFDIAGTGRADPTSLIEALRTAWHMAENRGTR
ncbi:MAG: 4-hydroxythreonine-4-phosphate dehydrogenase PdxA [Paracoccaceae bacterium]